jgi:hypothetical protein
VPTQYKKLEKREKEQNERSDALIAENKNLAEQMKKNNEIEISS